MTRSPWLPLLVGTAVILAVCIPLLPQVVGLHVISDAFWSLCTAIGLTG